MAKPDVIVGTIHSISPPGEKRISAAQPLLPVTMKLHSGQSVQLDMSMPQSKAWADILTSLHQLKQAVYLKIDPQSGMVADLLLPRVVKVASVKAANLEGDIEVELIISAARHYLRRSNPDYKKLLVIVEDALKTGNAVLVTDSRDRQEIVDVRPVPETVAEPGYLSVTQARQAHGEPHRNLSPSGKGGVK